MREAEIEAEVAAVEAGQRVCAIEGCPLRALSVHHVGDEGAWRMVVAVCWYHGEEHIWSGSVGVRQRGAQRLWLTPRTTAAYARACAYQRDARRVLAETGQDPDVIEVLRSATHEEGRA